jgi:hypothetical protein
MFPTDLTRELLEVAAVCIVLLPACQLHTCIGNISEFWGGAMQINGKLIYGGPFFKSFFKFIKLNVNIILFKKVYFKSRLLSFSLI